MGKPRRARSNRPNAASNARALALKTAQLEDAAHRTAADHAAAEESKARSRRQQRMRVFAVGAEAWLLVAGIAVAVAPHAPAWLRVLGTAAVLAALTQLGPDLGARWPAGIRRPRSRHHGRPAEGASLLDARNPELAARVKDALALLGGPVGQLVDSDVVASTRSAFTAGVHRVDQLYQQEIDLRSTLATLGDNLHATGRSSGDDEQYQDQQADLARLRAQREQADDDLSAAAATLSTSVTEAAFGNHRRAAGAQLSVQRRRALSSDSAPDLVLARGSGALTELTDAVDGVRARLEAIHELDAITDRFAPDAAEAEVDR